MGKVIEMPKRIKHSAKSRKFAEILHSNWPEEFSESGERKKIPNPTPGA